MAISTIEKNKMQEALKARSYKSDVHSDWCPGCGDFGIVNGIQQALAELQLAPWRTAFFSGVGCSGKAPHYVHVYGVHTLHGRVLPFSLGAKMANPELTVVAAGGDGDGLGIGAAHFVHAGRRNIDITYIIFNNEVYGLTKGQASPTLAQGEQPKSLALPNINNKFNAPAMALTAGYTFVARTYAFDAKHLKETLIKAISHRGMAYVDILQPCPTYNNLRTKDYYSGTFEQDGQEIPRIYYVENDGYDGIVKNPGDINEVNQKRFTAYERLHRIEDQVPVGVFYQIELPTYHDRLADNIPILKDYTPASLPIADDDNRPTTDLTNAMAHYLM